MQPQELLRDKAVERQVHDGELFVSEDELLGTSGSAKHHNRNNPG